MVQMFKVCQGQDIFFSPVEQNYNLEPLNFKHIALPQRVTGMQFQHCARRAGFNSDAAAV